jgi:hypothetical protein
MANEVFAMANEVFAMANDPFAMANEAFAMANDLFAMANGPSLDRGISKLYNLSRRGGKKWVVGSG